MYRTQGIIRKKDLEKTIGKLLTRRQLHFVYFIYILLFIMSGVLFFNNYLEESVIPLILMIPFHLSVKVIKEDNVRKNMKLIKELHGIDFFALSTSFDKEGINIETNYYKESAKYNLIKAIYSTKDFYVLEVNNHFTFVFRTVFDEQKDEEFQKFITLKTKSSITNIEKDDYNK
ncbi:MAG: YcxB family protein [Thomasclavelia sp.]|nr:YcxB family protein [Thomasclavelia sp.]